MGPLTNLLAKDVPFEFDDACLKSFEILKKALISAPIIQPPDWSPPFEIMCDACDYVVGQFWVLQKIRSIHYYRLTYHYRHFHYCSDRSDGVILAPSVGTIARPPRTKTGSLDI